MTYIENSMCSKLKNHNICNSIKGKKDAMDKNNSVFTRYSRFGIRHGDKKHTNHVMAILHLQATVFGEV